MKNKLFVLLAALMITVTSTWAADTTRPTFNGDVTVSNITETGLTLSWNPATDDVTPQEELEYLVQKRERFQVDWITQVPFTANLTSYTATNLVSGTNYEFCITVRDAAGNETYKYVEASPIYIVNINDYGVTFAGVAYGSIMIKPNQTLIINGGDFFEAGTVKIGANETGSVLTLTLDNATISTPSYMESLIKCDGSITNRMPLVVLEVNGNCTFNAAGSHGIDVSMANLLIRGSGTLNINATTHDIFCGLQGVVTIGDNVTIHCSSAVGSNMDGKNGESLIIGEHAYLTVKRTIERLQTLTLNDDIRVLRPTGASVGQAASGYAVLHNGKAANNIVIGETYRGEAAVDAIENEAQTTGQHYTLDGRRVEGVPSRKGVYIVNGKKTVIM